MLTSDSLIHSGNPQPEIYTISSTQRIERKDLGDGKYEDTLFIDSIPVFTLASENTDIVEIYTKYFEEQQKQKMEGMKTLSMAEKAKHMRMIGYDFYGTKNYSTIDIGAERKTYPDIDIFLDTMIHSVADWEGITYEEALEKHFILDEEAKNYVKRGTVEGLAMNQEELAEKVGDLYYDALAAVISRMADSLKKDHLHYVELGEGEDGSTDPNTLDKITINSSQILQQVSTHILSAWEICKPFLKAPLNPKHTTDIEGIPNAILGERIGRLNYGKLSEFLKTLSVKIYKDGEADKGRGRIKLSTELFESSKLIHSAGRELEKVYK